MRFSWLVITLVVIGILAVPAQTGAIAAESAQLTVNQPLNNAVVADQQIEIRGTAPVGDTVRHERSFHSDPKIAVDADGHWQYSVKLSKGKNKYTFHLDSSSKTKVVVYVFFNPDGPDALSVLDPPSDSIVSGADMVIHGKAKPGDTVRHEKAGASDPKIAVDADGQWEYSVHLKKGTNSFTFHLGSSKSSQAGVSVTYDPNATSTPSGPSASSLEEEAHEAAGTANDSPGAAPAPPATPGILYVYFFDVSLGDAIYIRTPTGEDVVIDGGDSRNELSTFLDQLGETAIDVVVASHPHADHIGGLPRLVNERQVGQVWDNGEPYTTQVFKDLAGAIAGKGVPEHTGKVGDSFTLGGVKFTVLGPLSIGRNINDNSLVIRADCGSSSFLFAGDAEIDSDSKMVASGADLDVDVLKLGHHGSRTSTSSQLIAATTPRLAIYQARVGNQFGHPHQETLDRLAAAHVPTFGTGAAGGTVVVSTACDDVFSVSPHFEGFADVLVAAAQPGPTSAPAVSTAAPPAATAAPQPTVPPPPAPTQAPTQTSCHPSYVGACLQVGIGDYDCGGGAGDGPNYVYVRVTVVGPDEFGLNSDPQSDNFGCDSLPPP